MERQAGSKQKLRSRAGTRLEKEEYPSGVFSQVGEHIRVLTQNESRHTPPVRPANEAPRLQCIAVPTHRDILKNRKNIQRTMQLAADHQAGFVLFLCSGQAKKEDIALLARKLPGLHWMAIDGPFSYEQQYAFQTTQSPIAYGSEKDVSQKRNLALQLARLMGWETLLFLDDDVRVTLKDLSKTADLLRGDVFAVGFSARQFPDNSVVVHAGRWANGSIDSFIGAGALAVKTTTPYLSFFPHVYNEDWLFLLFYCLLEDGGLTWAGTIGQRRYNPFHNAKRARTEEPGDLLGESLLRLAMSMKNDKLLPEDFEDMLTTIGELADEHFWEHEINERILFIRDTERAIRLKKIPSHKKKQALQSLTFSLKTLIGPDGIGGLRAKELAAWVKAWIHDIRTWNELLAQEPQCTNICDALAYLSITNEFIYSYNKSPVAPPLLAVHKKPGHPELAELPNIRRLQHVIQGLRYTKTMQQFLENIGCDMGFIFDSAQQVRFDRPAKRKSGVQPPLSIGLFVACDEPPGLVSKSVRNIRQWLPPGVSALIIVWVYNPADHTHRQLRDYRDRIVARLIPEIAGSDMHLCSAVLRPEYKNIDHFIDNALTTVAAAYWKYHMPADHPIFIVNTRGELLRSGTFRDFLKQQHEFTSKPLRACLQPFKPVTGAAAISPAEDDQALAQCRANLAAPPVQKRWMQSLSRSSSTKKMQISMRRARLQWLETDDLAYSVSFHDPQGIAAITSIKEILCLPVAFRPMLASDLHAIVQDIIEVITTKVKSTGRVECMIIVHGTNHDQWEQMLRFRNELLALVQARYTRPDILFTSFVCHPDYATTSTRRQLKQVSVATIRYVHWLQNHHQIPAVSWLEK